MVEVASVMEKGKSEQSMLKHCECPYYQKQQQRICFIMMATNDRVNLSVQNVVGSSRSRRLVCSILNIRIDILNNKKKARSSNHNLPVGFPPKMTTGRTGDISITIPRLL